MQIQCPRSSGMWSKNVLHKTADRRNNNSQSILEFSSIYLKSDNDKNDEKCELGNDDRTEMNHFVVFLSSVAAMSTDQLKQVHIWKSA